MEYTLFSVRGSRSCRVHLGKLVSSISAELGGSGGGHDKACGAVIPKNKIKKFMSEMNSQLTRPSKKFLIVFSN